MGPLHGLLVLQENAAEAWALHTLQLPSGYVHLFQHGVPHRLQCGYLLHCGSPWATRGQSAPPWSPFTHHQLLTKIQY